MFRTKRQYYHIRAFSYINLIPFKESMIVIGQLEIEEIIYNILVFVPLGVYVSIIFNKWSFRKKYYLLCV